MNASEQKPTYVSPAALEAEVIADECILPGFTPGANFHVDVHTSNGVIRFRQLTPTFAHIAPLKPTYLNDCGETVEIKAQGFFYTEDTAKLREYVIDSFAQLIARMGMDQSGAAAEIPEQQNGSLDPSRNERARSYAVIIENGSGQSDTLYLSANDDEDAREIAQREINSGYDPSWKVASLTEFVFSKTKPSQNKES